MVHFNMPNQVSNTDQSAARTAPKETYPKTSQALKQNASTAVPASSSITASVSQTKITTKPNPSDQLPPAPDRPQTIPELIQHKTQKITDCETTIKELSAKISGLSSIFIPSKRDDAKTAKTKIAELRTEVATQSAEVAKLKKTLDDQQTVTTVADRLNSTSPERTAKLDEMRSNLQILFSGEAIPEEQSQKLALIPLNKCMEEIFRLAPSTKIMRGDRVVQDLQNGCHDRSAATQPADDQARFTQLVNAYKTHSKESVTVPDCLIPSDALKFGGSDEALRFNDTMQRLVRTSTQTLYTGYLTKEDIISHFPSLRDKLFMDGQQMALTLVPASQEITRRFNNDGTYEVDVKVTVEFKKREKEEGQQFATDRRVATMDVTYALKFDSKMDLMSLQSSAALPQFEPPS